MTGLEKILSQIEYESNDRCQTIISNAQEKANEIISEAQAEADKSISESNERLEKKLSDIQQSSVSSAELAKSKIILKAKLEGIDGMLEKAIAALKALPDAEYFDMLKTLIIRNAKDGEGVLHLSSKDESRLPDGFVADVNKALDGNKTVVPGDCVDIESGFLLTYGDIDINCTFDAIAASKRDELRDTLNTLLFDEQEARIEE